MEERRGGGKRKIKLCLILFNSLLSRQEEKLTTSNSVFLKEHDVVNAGIYSSADYSISFSFKRA